MVKTGWRKTLALLLSCTLVLALFVMPASAIPPESVTTSFEDVAIVQKYNSHVTPSAVHNYYSDGDLVNITYSATLKMTELMAEYLAPREKNLYDAQFEVKINIKNGNLLEMDGSTQKVTFSSTFLKPVSTAGVTMSYSGGRFTYEAPLSMYWATRAISGSDITITVPMELIVYYDGTTAYGYPELPAVAPGTKLMYADFDAAKWQEPITLEFGDFKVKDGVAATVTYSASTWKKISATGTITGKFSYATDPLTVDTISVFVGHNYVNHVEFGNASIPEWKSNEVKVLLKREAGGTPGPGPVAPSLNTEDHFAYVIGFPDGLVHPEGRITRAEVATIFFRMLTDEVRNQYWSQANPYNDVKLTDWFNNAISTLTNMKIINGYPDGGFHPNANITRAEFAAMAVRFFVITEDMTYTRDAFTDIADSWANYYINMAYLLQIINGYPDGTYRPANPITRAEAMTIVNNTLRRSPCNEGMLPEKDMITWPDNMNRSMWYYAAVQEATNSHDYQYFDNGKENWTEELPVRDWAAFERAWSDANSAYNPGEVVDGH